MRIRSPVLIGRERELELLRGWLADARAGRPRLVVIGGEAGIGKSRLLDELSVDAQSAGMRWLAGGAADYGAGGLPFGAVVEALRPTGYFDAARAGPGLSAETAADEGFADVDGHARLFESLLALLERASSEQPTALALEDLHWADTSTREFLAFLARNLGTSRLLVLATYRSDDVGRDHPLRRYLTGLARLTSVERLTLERLGRDEVAAQLRAIRGSEPSLEELERVYGRGQGNPLFSEELLAADEQDGVPVSLHDMLLARVERLPPESRALTAALSVAVTADEALLADVIGLAAEAVFGPLRTAIDGQVVQPHLAGYGFRHALIREAVYQDLLAGERTLLHGRVAESLARSVAGDDWDARRLAQLAYHWQRAGRVREALIAAWRAAQAAERGAAFAEAALQYERILELWQSVEDVSTVLAGQPAGPAMIDLAEIHVRAGKAADTAGELLRATAHYRAALDEIDAESQVERAAMTTLYLAGASADAGDSESAGAAIDRALELARRCEGSVRLTVMSGLLPSMILFREAEVPRIARELVAEAEAVGDEGLRMRAYGAASRAEALWFSVDRGLELNDAARDLARAAGDDRSLASLEKNRATILQMAGRFEEGLDAITCSQALAERLGVLLMVRHNEAERGQMLYRLGRWAAAERAIDESIRPPTAEWGRVLRGQLLVGMGRFAEAQEELLRAWTTVEGSGSSASFGPYYAALAEMAIWQERTADARAALDAGLPMLRRELDMRWVAEQSLLALRVHERPNEEELAWQLRTADEFRQLAATELARPTIASREVLAALAVADAEQARLEGAPDAAAWAAAAAAWSKLREPYPEAYATYRQGEALLGGGDRHAAAEVLGAVAGAAIGLGARPLLGAIESVARRARLDIGRRLADDGDEVAGFGLTAREREVLVLVARGYSDKRIAQELFISPKTASVHVSNVKGKLGVEHRVEAAAIGLRLGLGTGEPGTG